MTLAAKGSGAKRVVPASVRVAVYCRQSVEREMEFSSCDAQRATIEAYVTAQACNGWMTLPERYDDAGYSGGNIQRPAFTRLMDDVRAGRIDTIAVYRIDRLSRSMSDFTATLNEFAKHSVSFVSVTQAFDTSTSTGQLMANLLGSFSQFERQQIGERIKDKLIETRRRGGWQAGTAPFGYKAKGGALHVVEAEAEVVRLMFNLYMDLNALSDVARELHARGVRTRSGRDWVSKDIHRLLRCRIFEGFVPCEGQWYDGKHQPIVDRDTFEMVQRKLSRQRTRGGSEFKNKHGMLLRGILYCAGCNDLMAHTYSMSGVRRWFYYACTSRYVASKQCCPGARVSAHVLESFVVDQIQGLGSDPRIVAKTIEEMAKQATARVPELEAERRRCGDEIRKLGVERENFVAAIANGGSAARSLGARVGELDEQLAALERRQSEVRGDLLEAANAQVNEDEIRAALAEFRGIWGRLVTMERVRVLRLLVERVDYDAAKAECEIKFRPGGIRRLAEDAGAVR